MESELIIKDIFEDMVIPPEFICPLTFKIMIEPVIAEDGYTYEKEAFQAITDSLSPVTRKLINTSIMIPNNALQECITRYKYELKNKDILERNITDTIVFNNFKFELELISDEQLYIRVLDIQAQFLYDGLISISKIDINPMNKFYSMILSSLNKDPDYNIIIKINNKKMTINFSYITKEIHIAENIFLNKNESSKVNEYLLINKIKELEKELYKLGNHPEIQVVPFIETVQNKNDSLYELSSQKCYEDEQTRLMKQIKRYTLEKTP